MFADRFNHTNGDLLKRPVFERENADWFEILPKMTKQYNIRLQFSTKLSPNEPFLRKNEGCAYQNLLHNGHKIKRKFKIHNLARTTDLKRSFSKGGSTNWSYKLYENTESVSDKIPSYRIDNLTDGYYEALLKKTKLKMKEKKC